MPLFSKHFRRFSGSLSLPCWLTKRLERRLQTIHCTQHWTVYKGSFVDSKPSKFGTLPCCRLGRYTTSPLSDCSNLSRSAVNNRPFMSEGSRRRLPSRTHRSILL